MEFYASLTDFYKDFPERRRPKQTRRILTDFQYERLCLSEYFSQESRRRNRAKGLCHCGDIPEEGFKTCPSCREKNRRDYHRRAGESESNDRKAGHRDTVG